MTKLQRRGQRGCCQGQGQEEVWLGRSFSGVQESPVSWLWQGLCRLCWCGRVTKSRKPPTPPQQERVSPEQGCTSVRLLVWTSCCGYVTNGELGEGHTGTLLFLQLLCESGVISKYKIFNWLGFVKWLYDPVGKQFLCAGTRSLASRLEAGMTFSKSFIKNIQARVKNAHFQSH